MMREISKIAQRSDYNIQRLRDLEKRVSSLETNITSLEQTSLEIKEDIKGRVLQLEDEINKVRDNIQLLESTIKDIVKEMKKFADKSELYTLKEWIDIYNPMRSNFVTKEEVKRLIEESKD